MNYANFPAHAIKFLIPYGRWIWHRNYNLFVPHACVIQTFTFSLTDEEVLDHETIPFWCLSYVKNTRVTYSSQQNSYFGRFCLYYGYSPVPAQPTNIPRYAVFLARSMLPTNICCYLNIVRVIHLEAGYSSPLENNWFLPTVTQRIRECRGTLASLSEAANTAGDPLADTRLPGPGWWW